MNIREIILKKQKEKRRRENRRVIRVGAATTVAGITIGAITGILLAPKSGKETRADIKVKANDIKEQLKDKSEVLKNNIDENIEKNKENFTEAKSKISNYLKAKKEDKLSNIKEIEAKEATIDEVETKMETK